MTWWQAPDNDPTMRLDVSDARIGREPRARVGRGIIAILASGVGALEIISLIAFDAGLFKKEVCFVRTHTVPVRRANPDSVVPARVAREFWQRFIDEVQFNVPDQPPPKHGGRNWVKIPMPARGHWLTCYGYEDRLGIYLSYDWGESPRLFHVLRRQLLRMRAESGVYLTFNAEKKWLGVHRNRTDIGNVDAQIAWLCVTANALVTAFRPRLERLAE